MRAKDILFEATVAVAKRYVGRDPRADMLPDRTAKIFNALTGHALTDRDVRLLAVAAQLAGMMTGPFDRSRAIEAIAEIALIAECTEPLELFQDRETCQPQESQ